MKIGSGLVGIMYCLKETEKWLRKEKKKNRIDILILIRVIMKINHLIKNLGLMRQTKRSNIINGTWIYGLIYRLSYEKYE